MKMKNHIPVGGNRRFAAARPSHSGRQGRSGRQSREQRRLIKDLTAAEGAALIAANRANGDFVILDVRTSGEFSSGHIRGAINLDFYQPDFHARLSGLDKSKTYLVYCRSGNRSEQAVRMMQSNGFSKVYNLLGGFAGWYQEGLPLE